MNTPSRIAGPERRDDDGEGENKVSAVMPGNSRSMNVAGIAALFVSIGPLVGGIFYGTLGTVFLFLRDLPSKGFFDIILFVVMTLLSILDAPYSYIYGAAPAAAAGLAIGMLRLRYGRLNVPLVLAVGAVVGVIYALALPRLPSAAFPKFAALSGWGTGEYVLLGVTCVVATLICWRVFRSFPLPGE